MCSVFVQQLLAFVWGHARLQVACKAAVHWHCQAAYVIHSACRMQVQSSAGLGSLLLTGNACWVLGVVMYQHTSAKHGDVLVMTIYSGGICGGTSSTGALCLACRPDASCSCPWVLSVHAAL